jgi:hypothetical protein
MPRVELFPFRYRDPVTGKWRHARHKAELHVIREEHREGEWEITGPPDVREVDPSPCTRLPQFVEIVWLTQT